MKPLWKPTEERVKRSQILKFMEYVNTQYNKEFDSYNQLYEWSVTDIENFWKSVSEFTKIKYIKRGHSIVENLDSFAPETNWFEGYSLNFAQNLLKRRDQHEAIIYVKENGSIQKITYADLYLKVNSLVEVLRSLGVKPGERLVGYLPNSPETIIAMLATTALGGTWASCGAELGAQATIDRLGQIEPKVLFTCEDYLYKGKKFDLRKKAEVVAKSIPSIETTIIKTGMPLKTGQLLWEYNLTEQELMFTEVPFEHPLFIMFSSGTTGKPKCLTQGTGGVLINHLKELMIHTDLTESDKLMYLTSPSWMMWNWQATALAIGTTIVLFDGNPLYPDWKTVFNLIDRLGVTVFGCSATYILTLKNMGLSPKSTFDLSSLKEISQTGSALSEEGFEYVYSEIKSDLHFNSISGGTDINGCFAIGSPIIPVYSGELQSRGLGMKVKAYDENANPVYDQEGELVCELPTPSMPIYFWNDPDNQKYFNAYFNYFTQKRVWRHGDYILIDSKTGGVIFFGRSDSVLKPSGVRIGTAEIYNIVENLSEIEDSLAIGQSYKNDQRILLFVKLNPSFSLTEELKNKIKKELKIRASPRHVPAIILETPDIPYTFSGKKVESAVTNIINGKPVTNRGALRNPESLDWFSNLSIE